MKYVMLPICAICVIDRQNLAYSIPTTFFLMVMCMFTLAAVTILEKHDFLWFWLFYIQNLGIQLFESNMLITEMEIMDSAMVPEELAE